MSEIRLKLYKGTWCAVWHDGKTTKRKSLRVGGDRAKAERQFANYIKNLEIHNETIEEIMEAYLKDKSDISSFATAKRMWNKTLKPFFGNLQPHHITRDRCKEYAQQRIGVSTWTIRRELGVLRAGVLWHNKRSPAVFELPPEGKSRERYLTKEEAQKLIECATSPHIKLFIILGITTAGRMSAILELTWDRVDFEHGFIKLSTGSHRTKNRATVPMNDDAREALEEAYKARTSNFVIEFGGGRVKSIRKGLAATAARAKLEGVSAHVLRHTAAVWMALDHRPISRIAQYLGHTDSRITEKHYAKFSPEHLKEEAGALSLKRSK